MRVRSASLTSTRPPHHLKIQRSANLRDPPMARIEISGTDHANDCCWGHSGPLSHLCSGRIIPTVNAGQP
jgi:hypothetical protein